jgi:hypothetical protein
MIRVRVQGIGKLKSLSAALANPERVLEAASKVGSEQTLSLIGKTFKRGTDPYGVPWNAPNNLQITGGIRSYARGKTDSGGWEVHSTDEKAIWHHAPKPRAAWGDKSLPQRLQVPTEARGLPPAWAAQIVKVVELSLAMNLKRAMRAG